MATRGWTSSAASREAPVRRVSYLQVAEKLIPEQTRTHRVARAVARDLLRLSGSRVRPELRELAERFGVAS